MGNSQVETIQYLMCGQSFPQNNIMGVPRDGLEQGVIALLLLSGTVGAIKRRQRRMQGAGLQNYLIDIGEDDGAGGRNPGWGLSNILTSNWCFRFWNMKE